MYKVKRIFRDKYTNKLYAIGDNFTSNENNRIKDLSARGLIEGVAKEVVTPSFDSMTKNELVKLLVDKGIEFNKRQTKEELVELLQGGE